MDIAPAPPRPTTKPMVLGAPYVGLTKARKGGNLKTQEAYMPSVEKQWVRDDGKWLAVKGEVSRQLPAGIYELIVPQEGPLYLKEMTKIQTDNLVTMPDSVAQRLVKLTDHFWLEAVVELHKEMGVLHKRGVLLQGDPGGGKTATCLLVAQELVRKGGIVVFVAPNTAIEPLSIMLQSIREGQPDTPLMTIFEDIDKHNNRAGQVPNELLAFLDGEAQVNHIFHLATTNFIEKLDARLLNRPSRFDEIIKVASPSKAARVAYIRKLVPASLNVSQELLDTLAKSSEGLMFAHIKELVICTIVYGMPIEETTKRLAKQGDSKGAGFTPSAEETENEFVFMTIGDRVAQMLNGGSRRA